MKKYLKAYQSYLGITLEYRAELITSILFELITTADVFILWIAIFQYHDTVGGLNIDQVLTYYLLIPLVGNITHINASKTLGPEIKDGVLSNYLLKPYQTWVSVLMRTLAKKTNILAIVIPFYILIILIYSIVQKVGIIHLQGLIYMIIISILGIAIHFTIDLIMSWSAFWIDDVWFFNHLKNILFGIFSGKYFPFQFLSPILLSVFTLLPFKFLYYVPVSYLIQVPDFSDFIRDLSIALIWLTFLCLICVLLWKRGIQKYEAYGR